MANLPVGSEAHFEDFHQLICGVCAHLCANKPSQYACPTRPMTRADKSLTFIAMTRTLREKFQSGFSSDSASPALDQLEFSSCCWTCG